MVSLSCLCPSRNIWQHLDAVLRLSQLGEGAGATGFSEQILETLPGRLPCTEQHGDTGLWPQMS